MTELEALRGEYLADLPRRAATIERLHEEARAGAAPPREELLRQVHQLAGTAGSFGEQAISDQAAALERALRSGAPGGELLRALTRALRAVPAPPPPALGSEPSGTWVREVLMAGPAPAELAPLSAALSQAGLLVRLCDLTEAAAAPGLPGLVVLDAGADGRPAALSTLRELRAQLPTGTPILFLTAQAELAERVQVTSAGATLCLRKPVSAAGLLAAAQRFAPGPFAGCSVLVVDDDPHVEALVSELLRARGVAVRVARDPDAFWRHLEADTPSLVLLDISLPVFDGFALCRAVKADLRFREVPIVFLSARLSVEDRTAAFTAGADDYIPKPIAPAEFLARVTGRLRSAIEAKERARELQEEQAKSERLLLNILPAQVAKRLKRRAGTIADAFADVTVLFADLVGFSRLAAQHRPEEVVELLGTLFSRFDELAERFGLEKIKTIGDAYMVVGGLPTPRPDHAEAVAEMALALRQVPSPLPLRMGMHCGKVVAGVIGTTRFSYDVWGDTVNVASRMESQGLPGEIQVSEELYQRLAPRFRLQPRGLVPIKDLGEMRTYLLQGKR